MQEIMIEDRQIPADEKQNCILEAFDSLKAGQSLTILYHYNPEHLENLLHNHRPYQSSIEHILKGPYKWKVKLTKKISEGRITLH